MPEKHLQAMAVEDDVKEGSLSSFIVDSLKYNWNGDVQSNEDLAWVDSCLIKDSEILDNNWTAVKDVQANEDLALVDSCRIKDSEILDNNWTAVKDALLEIVDSHPESLSYSAAGIESSPVGTDMEIRPSGEDAENAQSPGSNDVSANANPKKIMNSYEFSKNIIARLLEDHPSDNYVLSPSVPIYRDSESLSEVFDSGLGSDLLAVEMEPPSEDIFKVWDLGFPAEEDELFKQLKTALVDTSFQSTPSAFEDLKAWDLKDESLDSLIDGIADLSLSRNSP